MDAIKGFIKGVLSDTKKTIIAGIILLVIIVIAVSGHGMSEDDKAKQEALKRQEELNKELETTATEEPLNESGDASTDSELIKRQPDLIARYGSLPEGYIWDEDGTLLSLGDKDMTAEEVVYSFLNGLRTLDISMAQKYSRRSKTVSNYSDYFNSSEVDSDYYDSFIRNMYKEVLLSIQVGDIVDTSVFAENKQVFTIKLNVLDLTSKEFWVKDKDSIYNNLYIYSKDESDSTKGDIYLYDYVLNYYRSPDVVRRDVSVNLTVERYPDLNTGWLVSIDTDIDDLCNYSDGNLVVSYIKEMYNNEGMEIITQQREQLTATEETTKKEGN